jgi:ABC-type multidrug transport system fused ATPase/permease subunit
MDLAQVPADCWLSQITWVPQHPHLFTTTVAENIALGQSGARRPDIVTAARLTGADDFIRQLPQGYDTVLAEGARSLSAGQRQKIALARAFLRRAPVLLLDEPTAHLDPVSADRVLAAVDDELADRTVILITHQPPPQAGRIARVLVLDQGRLSPADAPREMQVRQALRSGLAVAP